MANGQEMLIIGMLKAFMPKDVAEKISAIVTEGVENGAIEKFMAVPGKLEELSGSINRLHSGMAALAARLDERELNPVYSASYRRLVEAAPSEHRADGCGAASNAGGDADAGHGGSSEAA